MMVADHAQEPKSHGINELLPLQRTWSAPLHKEREKGKEGENRRDGEGGERGREKEKNWSIAEKDTVYEAAIVAHFNNCLLR